MNEYHRAKHTVCNLHALLAKPQGKKTKVICLNPKKGSKVYCSPAVLNLCSCPATE